MGRVGIRRSMRKQEHLGKQSLLISPENPEIERKTLRPRARAEIEAGRHQRKASVAADILSSLAILCRSTQ